MAYREVDDSGGVANLWLLPVQRGGGALAPQRVPLRVECPEAYGTDGVALVTRGIDGEVVLAESGCEGTKARLAFIRFQSTPDITYDGLVDQVPANGRRLFLSGPGVLATRARADDVAFVEDGVPKVAPFRRAPAGTFGGTADMTGAWAAGSDQAIALLAAGPLASDGTPSLGLVLAPADTPLDAFNAAENKPRAPITFPGTWGAVSVLGSRAIVLGGGADGATLRLFDVDGDTIRAETRGVVLEDSAGARTGVAAVNGQRAYFALLAPGSVSVHVYGSASTIPTLLRRVNVGEELLSPSVTRIRDGHVAIAATESQVAVAWTTATKLTADDRAGGYAIFSCAP